MTNFMARAVSVFLGAVVLVSVLHVRAPAVEVPEEKKPNMGVRRMRPDSAAIADPPAPKPVEITVKSFEDLENRGLLERSSLKGNVEGLREAREQDEELRVFLRGQLGGDPRLTERFATAPNSDGSDLHRTEAGDYQARLKTRDGRAERVVLLGPGFGVRALSETLTEIATATNEKVLYVAIYEGIRKAFANDPGAVSRYLEGLPEPGRVPEDEAGRLRRELLNRWKKNPPEDVPSLGGEKDCSANCEETVRARALEGGRKALACFAKSADGLRSSADWPLESASTCVKDQGGTRGTAVAFAISAAVEALVRREHDVCRDLSEQHLHYQQKNHWFPMPPNFGDDRNAPSTVLAKMVGGYAFRKEGAWNYNLSSQRTDHGYVTRFGPTKQYANSCQGYIDKPCSDTNHQGQFLCERRGSACGFSVQIKPSKDEIKALGYTTFFDVKNPNDTIDVAPVFLALGVPIVASFRVPQSFLDAADDGFVRGDVAGRDDLKGWHVALIEGWVDNSDLEKGQPSAAGGGYFVVKNSWGPCLGDGGYWYVPKKWMSANAISMTAITAIQAFGGGT